MGELTGKIEIDERGTLTTPVYLCGSHAVGTVHHAAVLASGRGPDNIVLPVVGECDDGDMADSRSVVVADVENALAALGEDVDEGSVGAGTGMVCSATRAASARPPDASASARSGCCCSATSATATTSTFPG